jgi:hypothetical protein
MKDGPADLDRWVRRSRWIPCCTKNAGWGMSCIAWEAPFRLYAGDRCPFPSLQVSEISRDDRDCLGRRVGATRPGVVSLLRAVWAELVQDRGDEDVVLVTRTTLRVCEGVLVLVLADRGEVAMLSVISWTLHLSLRAVMRTLD